MAFLQENLAPKIRGPSAEKSLFMIRHGTDDMEPWRHLPKVKSPSREDKATSFITYKKQQFTSP